MADPVKFEFARPITPRVVDIEYISPPVCQVVYYSETPNEVGEL